MKCEICQRVVMQDEAQFADSIKPNTGMTLCEECARVLDFEYSVAELRPLPNLPGHTGPVSDITEEELAAYAVGTFRGAMDLEDNTQFAIAEDESGKKFKVWRTAK